MNWSFQLYSARKFGPWSDVLETVSQAGYTQVEGFGGLYDDPPGLRALLDRNGLSMPTGHFSLDLLEQDFAAARRIAGTLGIGTLVCPYLVPEKRPANEAGWRDFATRLAAVGESCREAGLRFAWHNHDFEFAPTADGALPMRIILDTAPGIGWEMDVAWIARGGGDPLSWIDERAARIVAVHVKDIAPAGTADSEDGWADVGHGMLPWPAIMRALREKTPASVFVMEHDNPADLTRFARRSIEAAANF